MHLDRKQQKINQSIIFYQKLNQCIRLSPEISPVHDVANYTHIDIALITIADFTSMLGADAH